MNNDTDQKKIDNKKMLNIISRGDKLILIAVILMLLALSIWMFEGTIIETISAKGVINCSNTAFRLSVPSDGMVSEMNNTMSDYVNTGDLIARVRVDNDDKDQANEGTDGMIDVRSDASGFITEINAYEGEKVDKDIPLLTIIKATPVDLDKVIAVVSYDVLDHIDVGTRTRVWVDGFSEEKFGYITGEVVETDLRIASKRRLIHNIGNEMVAETLIKDHLLS